MAIMTTISNALHDAFPDFSSVFSAVLLYGEVTAALVAGFGIYWETQNFGEKFERVAQRCVIWGVVAETFFTIALFVVDGHATAAANRSAAQAIERAARLQKETASLQLDLEREKSARAHDREQFAARPLKPETKKCLADKLRDFKKPIMFRYAIDQESFDFAEKFWHLFNDTLHIPLAEYEAVDDVTITEIFSGINIAFADFPSGPEKMKPAPENRQLAIAFDACGLRPNAISWMQFPGAFPKVDRLTGQRTFPDHAPDAAMLFIGRKPPIEP